MHWEDYKSTSKMVDAPLADTKVSTELHFFFVTITVTEFFVAKVEGVVSERVSY